MNERPAPTPLHRVKRIHVPRNDRIIIKNVDGSTQDALIPRASAALLRQLLRSANGKRTLATTGTDIGIVASIAPGTANNGLAYLIEHEFITRTDVAPFRRVRINVALEEEAALELTAGHRRALEILYQLGAGERTYLLNNREFASHFPTASHSAFELNYLIDRGFITPLTPVVNKLSVYRIDVVRRPGPVLNVERIAPEELDNLTPDERTNPTLLFAPWRTNGTEVAREP